MLIDYGNEKNRIERIVSYII